MPIQTIENITVAPNVDSVKITLVNPVAGAADYRAYLASAPTAVKYAGLDYALSNAVRTTIELNGLTPGVPVEVIVEAVDMLGPVPPCSMYTDQNVPLYPNAPETPGMTCRLGSNSCGTQDGNISTNGQGAVTNAPNVIARSAPFVVTPTAPAPIPSGTDAQQALFDTFASATITPVGSPDPVAGVANFELVTPSAAYDVLMRNADINNSQIFVMDDHVMTILFDGSTPGSNQPLHQGHGAIAVSPKQTFDLSAGKIAHFSIEVDSQTDSRRWVAFNASPASDPLTNFDFGVVAPFSPTGNVDLSDQGFFMQIINGEFTTNLYNKTAAGVADSVAITGALGQAPNWAPRGQPWGKVPNGTGMDCRNRFDLFLSQNHFQVYQDGVQVFDADIPGGLPFSDLKIYFTQYVYHTDNEVAEIKAYSPNETYWLNMVPYSDERHWDNFGAEVLPASLAWTDTASRIKLPVAAPAAFVSAPSTTPAPPPPTSSSTGADAPPSTAGSVTEATDPDASAIAALTASVAALETQMATVQAFTVRVQAILDGALTLLTPKAS